MEEFYLVLIKKDGTVVHDMFATSHKDLIDKFLSFEEIQKNDYFRGVFSPMEGRRDDVDNYQLIISETFVPEWFNGGLAEDILSTLKGIINSMIIKGRKKLLLHEGVILTNNAVIDDMKYCVVFGMYMNAKINVVDYATEIKIMTEDTYIGNMYDGSKVLEMYGFSKVNEMHDYSKIVKMYGRAKVNIMHDNSRIGILKGDANIKEMYEEAQADRLKHMSRVNEMHGHTVIEEMWDWSTVEKMFDNSRINYMDEDSKIFEMYGDSMVEEMHGNSVIERLAENSLVRKLNDAAKILNKGLWSLE